jgi:hypothetical protein
LSPETFGQADSGGTFHEMSEEKTVREETPERYRNSAYGK